MPKKKKPKAVMVDGIPIKPISAAEHRRLDRRIKKKYEKLRRRYPEVQQAFPSSGFRSYSDTKAYGPPREITPLGFALVRNNLKRTLPVRGDLIRSSLPKLLKHGVHGRYTRKSAVLTHRF